MKKSLLLISFFLMCLSVQLHSQKQALLNYNQEIRYNCKGANEVYIVWGINGWQTDSTVKTDETFIKDKLFYTPMKREDGSFVVSLKVKPNTMIDYVFWVTKGPAGHAVDVWDVNLPQKDYHTFAAEENVITINSKMEIKPKESLTLLEFATPVFLAFLFLSIALYFVKRNRIGKITDGNYYLNTLAFGLAVFVILLFIRPSINGTSWDIYLHPLQNLKIFFISGYYDLLYITTLTSVFLLLTFAFRKFERLVKVLHVLFLCIAIISLVAGILNIRIVEALGKPFNLQWFYYSDFLKSADAKATMSSNISAAYIKNIILLVLSAICLAAIFRFSAWILLRSARLRMISATGLGLAVVIYLLIAGKALKAKNINEDLFTNPIVAFAGSIDSFGERPELFTMEVPDSLRYSDRRQLSSRTKNGRIKNVILFVMESTPFEYIQCYGSKYKVTPELDKYSANSILFQNVYAHAPGTNLSMVSLLGSMYPWLSCYTLTNERPDLKFPTISSELKNKGFRTAFFNSADNRFQKAGEFLANRSFDKITDCQGAFCEEKYIKVNEKWQFPDGKDDECTADQLVSWLSSDKGKPFFAAMWTYQTHYPYFVSGARKQFEAGDTVLNRYLNALNHDDYVFGKLMERLKNENLMDSTLVVVVGDHGEAFGRHNQITHAQKIYEENLHVPCLFIHPSFKGEKNTSIGGLVDIAPTILSLLGYETPDKWQGENLLSEKKSKRVYFFAPWSDYLFGYREGEKKFIYNATKNITEIYDVVKDPLESNNLVSELGDKVNLCHQRLAGWVQYHNNYMETLLKK